MPPDGALLRLHVPGKVHAYTYMTGFHSGAANERQAQQNCGKGFHGFSSVENVHDDKPGHCRDRRRGYGASERDHYLLCCRPLPPIDIQEQDEETGP